MQNIFAELSWRGLIHQATDQATSWLSQEPRTLYVGFDPTADSLHVGSLLPLLLLRRFQLAGHRPIALLGGATGMIGDPSGKSDERNLLSVEVLRANAQGIEGQMRGILDFDCGPQSALLVDNLQWMGRFGYLDFLREVGKHFPVNTMMAKDSVKGRLEREDGGISYTEFSYMLLQAYDFVQLSDQYDCHLQAGGSDQWGNITAGIDLARRMRGVQLYGLTCPLLTKSDGTKMGKTESGTIWLSAQRTSPYQFYQYWLNVADEDTGRCLRYLTDLPREEIEGLDEARGLQPQRRESQRRLAEELTRLVHGPQGLAVAQKATRVFFGEAISDLTDAQLTEIFADVPSKNLTRAALDSEGVNIVDALLHAGLARTKSEARRIVQQGGAYVNNRRQEGVDVQLTARDLASDSIMVLRSGKKNYALLRFSD